MLCSLCCMLLDIICTHLTLDLTRRESSNRGRAELGKCIKLLFRMTLELWEMNI
jgi:hypothetical protein